MTSPRIYEDPIGTDEVQEERGTDPQEKREGLVDVEPEEEASAGRGEADAT